MENRVDLYFGRGTAEMFDDYMDFINYVFGFNGNSSDFKKLLPKLYKYEYEPAVSSYVVVENGKLKAAVGAFDHDITVCGEYLKTRGIGNVAVHPYTRGSGYMKKLMNLALEDMVKDGVVLSVLGGRRQRYNYFSFDKLGQTVAMSFNDDNMRHTFGKSRSHKIVFQKVEGGDTEIIKKIKSLSESYHFYAVREENKYFEILSSWQQSVYAGFDGGEFLGYAVGKGSDINEFLIRDEERIPEFISALFDYFRSSSMHVKIPAFLPRYVESLCRICEHYSIEPSKFFNVLDYKQVVYAFMKLKSSYCDMPDGTLVIDIDGFSKKEKIQISVCDNNVSVEYSDKDADLSLSHLDAMNLLFASVCPKRETLPAFAKIWLPLPIYIYNSDAV